MPKYTDTWCIFGSRTICDAAAVHSLLDSLLKSHHFPLFVHTGGANGADAIAEQWARLQTDPELGEPPTVYTHHPRYDLYGRPFAPKRRTAEMLIGLNRDALVVGFIDRPIQESRGSFFTWQLAKEIGLSPMLFNIADPGAPLFTAGDAKP